MVIRKRRDAMTHGQQFLTEAYFQSSERLQKALGGGRVRLARRQLAVRKLPEVRPAGGVGRPLGQQHPRPAADDQRDFTNRGESPAASL